MSRTFGSEAFGSGTFGGGTGSPVAVKRESIPDKLACRIDPPGGGQPARWSEDEALVANVMDGVTLSDEMPGGYKQANATLARDPRLTWPDLGGFGNMSFYLPGVEEVWDGRLEKSPDESGDNIVINPEGTGWQAALEDDKAAQIGIIDCDLSKWGDPSTQRVIDLLKANLTFEPSVSVGFQDAAATLPALIWAFARLTKGLTGNESWYYGDGIDIGRLLYNFKGSGEDVKWTDIAAIVPDDIYSGGGVGSEDYNGVPEANHQVVEALVNGLKYAVISTWREQGETELDPYRGIHRWEVPKVLGRHGMTLDGAWPEVGYVAKKCIEYIIGNFVKSLVVDSSLIENDGFVIPQAWYSIGAPAAALKDVTKYSLWDWFVYSKRKLQYRKPGSYGRFWKLYISESNIQDTGNDTSRLWDSIVVQYTEPGGKSRTVGPKGSGSNVESEALEVKDSENPAFKAVKGRRDLLTAQVSTPAAAIELGKRFLEEANLLPRSGSARISGYALDNKAVLRPVSQMHSGDYASFVDHVDTSYRKIVNKSYTHDSREVTIDFDAPPGGLEQLLERLQVVLIREGVA